jgi:putative aldouronate transport system substrate-binding protein
MKKKLKRGAAVFMVLTMILSAMTGCGTKKEQEKTDDSSIKPTVTEISGVEGNDVATVVNHANREGLPLADEEITLTVGVKASTAAYQGDWEDLEWVQKLQESAGVKLEFKVYNGNEDVNLMFTSRDYPDISFNIGSDKQIQDAALGGDIIALDDLIAEWSPNWSSFFEEDDVARKICTMNDGHIYSLPMVRNEASVSGLRDQWLINKQWLDELELEVPKTTEEFYSVLKAFKENAGKGSIPSDVIPYYIYGITNNVGGALDLINSFGVRVSGETNLVTVDDNGKVEFNYTSEDMKKPLLYLRKLFEEELIPYECLTDNNDTYLVKTRSNPSIVGSFHSRQNPDSNNEIIVAMAPLDAENGKTSMTRTQTNRVTRNYYTIYSNCEYPEVAMRLADLIAEPDWSIQAMYGMFGDTYTMKNGDESYTLYPYEADAQGATSAPMNRVPLLITKNMADNLVYMKGSSQAQLATALEEVYKEYTVPSTNLYPSVIFDVDQTDRLSELKKDLKDYMNNTFANWMLQGGIEEGWDKYVEQMNKLGLEEYISILQDGLDTFNAK